MGARPVQISLDERLLERIDKDPETRERGRSAFIRSAVNTYLDAKTQRAIDQQIRRAYSDSADTMRDEVSPLIDVQAWPRK